MKPYNLPTELPTPPKPPAGHRGVYRGPRYNYAKGAEMSFCTPLSGWLTRTIYIEGPCNFPSIEYVELRKPPEGVAEVPDGWECIGLGPVKGWGLAEHQEGDILALYASGWDVGSGNNSEGLYCLRIGSAIHHENFDAVAEIPVTHPVAGINSDMSGKPLSAIDGLDTTDVIAKPEPATKTVETSSQLVIEPAKAREWHLCGDEMRNVRLRYGPALNQGERVTCREILPGESSLLEQATADLKNAREEMMQFREDYMLVTSRLDGHTASECFMNLNVVIDDLKSKDELLEQAVGHLRSLSESTPDLLQLAAARLWLKERSPTPAPEPEPFDWQAFWDRLSPWVISVCMGEDGSWSECLGIPKVEGRYWTSSGAATFRGIPPEFAPPAVEDWRNSLIQRPTPSKLP